jgi:uncharacterized protein with NRDE domain
MGKPVCTLAIYFRAFPSHPLVLAANRDEHLLRPSQPPGVLDADFGIFGGRDDRFGGTWFAVNRFGVAAAILNRRTAAAPDPSLRSRGLLCVEALRKRSARAARSWMEKGVDGGGYNPFNLLVADAHDAWVATNHARVLSTTALTPGLHLLTNLDLNDATCPRIAASYRLFAALGDDVTSPLDPTFLPRLQSVLGRHDTPLDPRMAEPGNSLCVHAGEYGTRSSTVVFLGDGQWTFFHTDEPPCRGVLRRQPIESSF